MKKSSVGKVLAGVGIGTVIGMMCAPRKGSETRKMMMDKFEELKKKIKEIDVEEVKQEMEEKIAEIKKDIQDLDKEKVLEIAKEKAENIKKKIGDLSASAKKKATPVINNAVDELRESAIKVTKEVLEKLEKSKK